MKTEVRFHGLEPSASLRDHAERRIRTQLGRFGRELVTVVVRVGDINGPKGGLDKRCRISVRGPRIGSATIEEFSGDTYSAVDRAVERVSDSISRMLERVRSAWRRPSFARRES
jgi:ribosome-associated translation inhibitor RaiA